VAKAGMSPAALADPETVAIFIETVSKKIELIRR